MFSRFVIYNFERIYNHIILKDCFKEDGIKLINEYKKTINGSIELLVNSSNNTLDANSIETSWFPQIECDVFISHSHKDANHIISFVGWLYKCLGIRAFLDSTIWESVYNFEDKLEQKYFEEDYECLLDQRAISNKAHSNALLILNSAIEKMIDSTECFLFVGTNNSLVNMETNSPWIYTENLFSNMVQRKELREYRQNFLIHEKYTADALQIKYKCSFVGYKEITGPDLLEIWKNRGIIDPTASLDYLYKMKGLIK